LLLPVHSHVGSRCVVCLFVLLPLSILAPIDHEMLFVT